MLAIGLRPGFFVLLPLTSEDKIVFSYPMLRLSPASSELERNALYCPSI
jgi:hypothetical protein